MLGQREEGSKQPAIISGAEGRGGGARLPRFELSESLGLDRAELLEHAVLGRAYPCLHEVGEDSSAGGRRLHEAGEPLAKPRFQAVIDRYPRLSAPRYQRGS